MNQQATIINVLSDVDLFKGLAEDELAKVAAICTMGRTKKGHMIFREDSEGDDIYIVYEGLVEIQVLSRTSDDEIKSITINTMFPRQTFGEMAIMENAPRSASAIASATPTTLIIIPGKAFNELCEQNTNIGYRVARNLIQDLIYKLRSSSLLLRGNIKWRDGQLSQL